MVEEESMKVGLNREDGRGGKHEGWFVHGLCALLMSVDCWRCDVY